MNYNKIITYCNKYNINRYTEFGKPLTYNKLKHVISDHTHKKHMRSLTLGGVRSGAGNFKNNRS